MNMNGLSVLTMENAAQWDDIVRSFLQYDVYYLSGYVKAFQLHGDGEPLLFYYQGANLRAINVVMKRDIAQDVHFAGKLPERTYFDFATPYGYGGWLLEGEGNPAPLYAAYCNWCQKNGVVSEFVRFHPVLKTYQWCESAYQLSNLGPTIAMDITSPQIIWSNLISQNRNKIRKAIRNGLRVYRAQNPETYQMFQGIYDETMRNDDAAEYYFFEDDFYKSVLEDLAYHAQVFYAENQEGEIVAAAIFLAANGQMHYHLSGSLREYQSLAPTNLILYEAAMWGCANGYKTLHLGGGVGAREDSLYTFKKSFYRGVPCNYFIGKKIFLPEVYEKLTVMRGEVMERAFFPRYRA